MAWLSKYYLANVVSSGEGERRARAIFAAVAVLALIESYRVAGLLPA